MGVLKASVPLFIDVTGKKLVEETIRTHRGVADAIAARNPTAAHDAMYLHLVYNRNMIESSLIQTTWSLVACSAAMRAICGSIIKRWVLAGAPYAKP